MTTFLEQLVKAKAKIQMWEISGKYKLSASLNPPYSRGDNDDCYASATEHSLERAAEIVLGKLYCHTNSVVAHHEQELIELEKIRDRFKP